MAESDLYSVRCESCQCSFAPETKHCVHCGAPLGTGLMAALRSAGSGSRGSEDTDGTEVGQEELRSGRNWLWIVTAILAMGFSLLRQCE